MNDQEQKEFDDKIPRIKADLDKEETAFEYRERIIPELKKIFESILKTRQEKMVEGDKILIWKENGVLYKVEYDSIINTYPTFYEFEVSKDKAIEIIKNSNGKK